MTIIDNTKQAYLAIKSNKTRALITMLIIAFGLMALVGILTAISSIKESISGSFSAMGSNSFNITKNKINFEGRTKSKNKEISYQEATDFKKTFDFPARVSIIGSVEGQFELSYSDRKTNPNIDIRGVDENYLQVSNLELVAGRDFTDLELKAARNVAILGEGVARKLFLKPEFAIDKMVQINSEPFLVTGVLKSNGATGFINLDNQTLIPILKSRVLSNLYKPSFLVTIAVNNPTEINQAKDEATGVFRISRNLKPGMDNDFEMESADNLTEAVLEQLSYVTIAATFIGLITLLGAGIGLMNIMLVSVTDRTREIGISKALGATQATIQMQFLMEAVMICVLGGLLGIVLGIGAGNAVSVLMKGSFIMPWVWIGLGIVFCFILGIAAGFYPARKASLLDSIEALRYE
jgi:putative ABC transport system permease protein